MLKVDLNHLESDSRFQDFCFRLAKYEFQDAIAVNAASWDGGRDIIEFHRSTGDIVWQCKFTRSNTSSLRQRIEESLNALDPKKPIAQWILCISKDVTGKFLDWLRDTISRYTFIKDWKVWDRQELLRRLEQHPDILQMFFFRSYKELEKYFRTDDLELFKFDLDTACGWEQPDTKVLAYCQRDGLISDLVFDLIVQNRGTIDALVHELVIELTDVQRELRGIPGEGLLLSQITYVASLKDGKPGKWTQTLDPPLSIKQGAYGRFKICLTDTGFAWTGALRITLICGKDKKLHLPWMRLWA